MAGLKQISTSQVRECIKNGEFGQEIIASNKKTAIVLTQSWCPEWASLMQWIGEIRDPDIAIWIFVYDTGEIFEEFLEFKEQVLGNREIPYLRYYREGKFITATNYVSKERFLTIFQG